MIKKLGLAGVLGLLLGIAVVTYVDPYGYEAKAFLLFVTLLLTEAVAAIASLLLGSKRSAPPES